MLKPGIFHTTSLAPSNDKILRHKKIKDNGSKITSIDEEGGLIDKGYDKFSKLRYSEKTLEQSAAVFGWGSEDTETLKEFTQISHKKYLILGLQEQICGDQIFLKYWGSPKNIPKRPYLLISSNMFSVSRFRPFYQNIEHLKNLGFFQRDPEFFLINLKWRQKIVKRRSILFMLLITLQSITMGLI